MNFGKLTKLFGLVVAAGRFLAETCGKIKGLFVKDKGTK